MAHPSRDAVTDSPGGARSNRSSESPTPLRLARSAQSGSVVSAWEGARKAVRPDGSPDLDLATAVAREVAGRLASATDATTLTRWEILANLGAVDLTVARVVEPHLDAGWILDEARRSGQLEDSDVGPLVEARGSTGLWQVYAAEGTTRLQAQQTPDGWRLTGEKPWCSLADRATHALITAWVSDVSRRLFAVDLRQDGVRAGGAGGVAGQASTWAARGLTDVRSTGLTFSAASAVPVGADGWYLTRPGFAWGGAGVAAVWYGATHALALRLRAAAGVREPDQIALLHLGAVDTALTRARAVLVDAAAVADDPDGSSAESVVVASRVRQVVADSAEEVLARVGHALGPAPLTGDETHARRVADLTVYLRQHHAERDLVAQGRRLLERSVGTAWW